MRMRIASAVVAVFAGAILLLGARTGTAGDRPRLAVFEFDPGPGRVAPADLAEMAVLLRTLIMETNHCEVIDADSQAEGLGQILRTQGRPIDDPCLDEECRSDLVKEIRADLAVSCSVGAVGRVCTLTCLLSLAGKRGNEQAGVATFDCSPEEAVGATQAVAGKLLGEEGHALALMVNVVAGVASEERARTGNAVGLAGGADSPGDDEGRYSRGTESEYGASGDSARSWSAGTSRRNARSSTAEKIFTCDDAVNFPGLVGWCAKGSYYGPVQLGNLVFYSRSDQDFGGIAQLGMHAYVGSSFYGIYQGFGYTWAQRFRGLVQGSVVNHTGSFIGLAQAGAVNMISEAPGVGGGSFYGAFQGGVVNIVSDTRFGIQAGVVNINRESYVLSAGAAHFSDKAAGIMIGGVINKADQFYGISAGAVNLSKKTYGLQVGAYNHAEEMNGLQIGVVNNVNRLRGVQLGAANIARSNDWPFSIGILIGW